MTGFVPTLLGSLAGWAIAAVIFGVLGWWATRPGPAPRLPPQLDPADWILERGRCNTVVVDPGGCPAGYCCLRAGHDPDADHVTFTQAHPGCYYRGRFDRR